MRLNPLLKRLDLPPKPDADSLSIVRAKIVFMRDISSVRQYFQRGGHGKINDVRAKGACTQGQRRHKPPVIIIKIVLSIGAGQTFSLQAVRKIDPALPIVSIRRPSSRLHKPITEHQQHGCNRQPSQNDAANSTRRRFSQNNFNAPSQQQSQSNNAPHRRKNGVDFNRRNPIQTYLRNGPRVDSALRHVSSPRRRFRGRPSAMQKLHSHIIAIPLQTQEPPRQNRLLRRWSIL